MAQRIERSPLLVRVRLGDARRFVDARHLHRVLELDLAVVHQSADRGCRSRLRRAGHRQMPFASHQAGRRIESDPARARQEDLAPGVQIREVVVRPGRSVERLHVRLQLDQVARHEPRRQAQVAQHMHQQPARVAAGAGRQLQRFLGGLHAGFEADQVTDLVLQPSVQVDQKIHRALLARVDARQEVAQPRRHFLACEIRLQGRGASRARRRTGTPQRFGSRKKSNGLYTAICATRSTVTRNSVVFSGKTSRAR